MLNSRCFDLNARLDGRESPAVEGTHSRRETTPHEQNFEESDDEATCKCVVGDLFPVILLSRPSDETLPPGSLPLARVLRALSVGKDVKVSV